ncbi:MAG: type II toxin-antitoxin system RelE/ParE family toxin [Defluviitaleaceae bacterium]|nr:type II toxin-antitoxin system RelE/ParE family toxin [Defluviitaleaceae bacterium]
MTPVFDRLWIEQGLNDDDLRELQSKLIVNPFVGDIMKETGGARKTRFALSNTGKSGGLRIIYLDIAHVQKSFLLLCYPKSKQDDLTPEQKLKIKRAVEALKGAL